MQIALLVAGLAGLFGTTSATLKFSDVPANGYSCQYEQLEYYSNYKIAWYVTVSAQSSNTI